MANVYIRLNPIDKVRMLATHVNTADFIGMLTPHIRDKASDGDLVILLDDPQGRSFTYIVRGDKDFIKNNSGSLVELGKGRSLTGVLMDKITNNEFTKSFSDAKKRAADMFNFNIDN